MDTARGAGLGSWLVAAAMLVGVWADGPVRAQDGLRLHLDAPDGCPGRARIEAQLQQLLGPGWGARLAPPIEARAEIVRADDGRWRLRLSTERAGAQGRRAIDARSCAALVDSVALIVALMVDPAAAEAEPEGPAPVPRGGNGEPATERPEGDGPPNGGGGGDPSRAAEPPQPRRAESDADGDPGTAAVHPGPDEPAGALDSSAPGARPAAAGATAPGPSARSSRRAPSPRWRLGAQAALDVGALPAPALGGGVEAAAQGTGWRGSVAIHAFAPRRQRLASMRSAGGDIWLALGGARGCWQWRASGASRWTLRPCAGLEAGAMGGRGFGVDDPGTGRSWWLGIAAGGEIEWRAAGWLAIKLRLEAVAALVRPRFVLEKVGVVHRTSPVVGRMLLGPEFEF